MLVVLTYAAGSWLAATVLLCGHKIGAEFYALC